MGSAGEPLEPVVAKLCRTLGRAVADRGCCLLTGACSGLPHEAVLGARDVGGHTVGVSPASSLREHVEVFGSPYREYDVLIFTGLGPMGRELVNIRSSDIVVVLGGRSGTLGEFAIAYEEGKLIGVDPLRLVDELLTRYRSDQYVCPCRPAGRPAEEA